MHFAVAQAISRALLADEDEDEDALDAAMSALSKFVKGITVQLEWVKSLGEYRLGRELLGGEEEDARHPFVTTVVALSFMEYWERYRDVVRLGVCRQCSRVYVKAKHGRKTRYCSGACRQKAYRERQKE